MLCTQTTYVFTDIYKIQIFITFKILYIDYIDLLITNN